MTRGIRGKTSGLPSFAVVPLSLENPYSMTVMGLQNHARNQVTLLARVRWRKTQDTQNETIKFQIPEIEKKNLCPETAGGPIVARHPSSTTQPAACWFVRLGLRRA
ncbi:hypothetical protein M419DRAFT_120576 [Trichoderma reesei RUT C-30]|uniref:Uncharacterized protein n=1 Tax=Hypocrea jecorina (strain ATCC 56765 / BCRC 32924 / NRRL 11460 / Rut C-30) TaxID=1344414 RepID=A0A024RZM5_HYPJR|nr:hypothetical protein M419DRAFT_120576 [Trichoderma reesei RUT C-30]